jgi:hypothetical protein
MKVQAVACDLTSCDSVARPTEDGSAPASWLSVNVAQNGRRLVSDAIFCSRTCLVTYVRDLGDAQPRRRRRTREQMAADEAAAAAEAEAVPEVGTEV